MMIQTSILTFFLWPTTIDRAISPSFQLSWTNFLASQLFNTSLTYSYHLTRSTAYLSRENFIFSLNKSTNYSQTFLLRTSRDCYNILSIQTRCYKNPDKPWRFLPTHQNLFQVHTSSLNAFPDTQIFLIFMTDSFFAWDAILNRFVSREIHARSSRRARFQNQNLTHPLCIARSLSRSAIFGAPKEGKLRSVSIGCSLL